MKKLITASLVTLFVPFSSSFAASDNAKALQIVEAALKIERVSDLDFGTAVQGDALKVVSPGTVEDNENASFLVQGEANKSFTISLPASTEMITSFGLSDDQKITVDSFTSFPSQSGSIGANGSTDLFVGATRAALRATQDPGGYEGEFTVTVVY